MARTPKSSTVAPARVIGVSWWRRLLARWRRRSGSMFPQDEAAAVRRAELLARKARIDDILTSSPNEHPHFTDEDRELLRRVRDNLAETISTPDTHPR
jgi:hypothetical protein